MGGLAGRHERQREAWGRGWGRTSELSFDLLLRSWPARQHLRWIRITSSGHARPCPHSRPLSSFLQCTVLWQKSRVCAVSWGVAQQQESLPNRLLPPFLSYRILPLLLLLSGCWARPRALVPHALPVNCSAPATPRSVASPTHPPDASPSARASSPDPTPSLTPATSHTSHAQQDKTYDVLKDKKRKADRLYPHPLHSRLDAALSSLLARAPVQDLSPVRRPARTLSSVRRRVWPRNKKEKRRLGTGRLEGDFGQALQAGQVRPSFLVTLPLVLSSLHCLYPCSTRNTDQPPLND